jgi:hypothetical protein
MSVTASSLAAIGVAATPHLCPEHLSVVAEPAMQVSNDTEFDPDTVVVRLDEAGGAKFWMPPLLAVELTAN